MPGTPEGARKAREKVKLKTPQEKGQEYEDGRLVAVLPEPDSAIPGMDASELEVMNWVLDHKACKGEHNRILQVRGWMKDNMGQFMAYRANLIEVEEGPRWDGINECPTCHRAGAGAIDSGMAMSALQEWKVRNPC